MEEVKISAPTHTRQAPAEWLNFTSLQQDGIKLLGLLLMIVDHANTALHLNNDVLMWLGYGAFPLFALVWGFNLAGHVITQRQATRLWLWALAAQPVYWQVMAPEGQILDDVNILFVFAVATQLVYWLDRYALNSDWLALTLASCLMPLWANYLDAGTYGWPGIFMMMTSYTLYSPADPARNQAWLTGWRPMIAVMWCICVVFLNQGGGVIPMLAGILMSAAVLLLTFPLRLAGGKAGLRALPHQFLPAAYIGHLALLGAFSAGWGRE